MKSKTFVKISMFFIVLLFLVNPTSSILSEQCTYNSKKNSLRTIEEVDNLKHSNYWTLPNIYITNWTTTNITYDWCNYENGYYIIENLTIIGVNGKNGIHIENTTENFIIRNCKINKGISLLRICNGHFINNSISFGQAYLTGTVIKIGIYMGYCFNSTIKNNFINGTTDWLSSAIMMYNCANIIVNENTLSSNEYFGGIYSYGLDIQASENVRVINNTIYDNKFGIRAVQSYLCKIIKNRIRNAEYGIIVDGNNHSIYNNTINNCNVNGIFLEGFNNSVFNNKMDNNEIGIRVRASYNIISNNTILKSELYGIYLEDSNHNLITGNFISYKRTCIKEVNCYGNFIKDNICHKIPGPIIGYHLWIILWILIITNIIVLKIKLKKSKI